MKPILDMFICSSDLWKKNEEECLSRGIKKRKSGGVGGLYI